MSDAGNFVEGGDVGRVGHGHAGAERVAFQHHGAHAARLALGQGAHGLGAHHGVGQVLEGHAQLARHGLGDLCLGDPAVVNKNAAQLAPGGLLQAQGLLQLGRLDQALLRQQVTQRGTGHVFAGGKPQAGSR